MATKIGNLTYFLFTYFYMIENKLNTTESGLEKVKFQSEEANTDEHLKIFLKSYLMDNNNINDLKLSRLCVRLDSKEKKVNIEELKKFKITNVYLPDELDSAKKKKILETKKSVYTNPDLYLEIHCDDEMYFESLELKSTKNNNIPGSSIQQVVPFEWVLFVKRNKNKDTVSVSTGYYINSITEKIAFPDRSPRPQVGFQTLVKWNKKNRICINDVLVINHFASQHEPKLEILSDWQDYLVSEWLEVIKLKEVTKGEKWFNNTIRKFAIKFLDYTDDLNEEEKEKLINDLKLLIEKREGFDSE